MRCYGNFHAVATLYWTEGTNKLPNYWWEDTNFYFGLTVVEGDGPPPDVWNPNGSRWLVWDMAFPEVQVWDTASGIATVSYDLAGKHFDSKGQQRFSGAGTPTYTLYSCLAYNDPNGYLGRGNYPDWNCYIGYAIGQSILTETWS